MLAGTAGIDITPSTDVWMDGMIRSHRSVGVHDRLFGRALVMADPDDLAEACAIVSADVCALTAQDAATVRSTVQADVGIPTARTIVAATHTHSGPATAGFLSQPEPGYAELLVAQLVTVVKNAAAAMKPVSAGCASGSEDTISHYRRLLADNGHVVMNWEPYPAEHIVRPLGQVDREVGVLKIVDAQGRPTCLLFNHAGHPNVLSGDNYLLSGDYPGLAQRLLEHQFGTTAIFTNGAQGTMDIDGLRDRDWHGVERTAKALADAVTRAASSIKLSADLSLRCDQVQYNVPGREITDHEWDWASQVLKQTTGEPQAMSDGVGDDYKALLFKELREAKGQDIPVEQVCIALNDTAFISFPGELFTEIGMRIKAQSPFRRTYVVGLANGYVGYVPTRKAIREGGYSVETRRVGPDAEDLVVGRSLWLLNNMCHSPRP